MNIRMVNTLQALINTIFMRMVISMNISIVDTPTKLLEILNKSVSKLVSSLGLLLGSLIPFKPLEILDKLGLLLGLFVLLPLVALFYRSSDRI